MKLNAHIYQFIIALDQLANTLCGGWADETLSARCWRCRYRPFWGLARRVVDCLFFWDKNHCQEAYYNEFVHIHKPQEYR